VQPDTQEAHYSYPPPRNKQLRVLARVRMGNSQTVLQEGGAEQGDPSHPIVPDCVAGIRAGDANLAKGGTDADASVQMPWYTRS